MNITIDDFGKLDIRMGTIISVEKVENADKLLKLQVDFGPSASSGSNDVRQIVSGIAESYSPEELVGKQCPFLVNLEPRNFRGEESQGMLLAIDVEAKTALLHPNSEVPKGSKIT